MSCFLFLIFIFFTPGAQQTHAPNVIVEREEEREYDINVINVFKEKKEMVFDKNDNRYEYVAPTRGFSGEQLSKHAEKLRDDKIKANELAARCQALVTLKYIRLIASTKNRNVKQQELGHFNNQMNFWFFVFVFFF